MDPVCDDPRCSVVDGCQVVTWWSTYFYCSMFAHFLYLLWRVRGAAGRVFVGVAGDSVVPSGRFRFASDVPSDLFMVRATALLELLSRVRRVVGCIYFKFVDVLRSIHVVLRLGGPFALGDFNGYRDHFVLCLVFPHLFESGVWFRGLVLALATGVVFFPGGVAYMVIRVGELIAVNGLLGSSSCEFFRFSLLFFLHRACIFVKVDEGV